ncbi:MAG: hypothetical protein AAF682_30095 [Planctomycetota bacterium]
MRIARIFTLSVAAPLVAAIPAAQSLDVDVKLVPPGGPEPGITGSVPTAPDTQISLEVSGGPVGGQAFVAFSSGTIPPLPTAFGELALNPSSITLLGTLPLDGVGGGGVASSFGTLTGSFQQAFQIATLDPVTAEVTLTGVAQVGYGADLTLSRVARFVYSADAQSWKTVVTNRWASAQPVNVTWFDASAGQDVSLANGTVPAGAFPAVSFVEFSGALDLDPGDTVTVSCGGADLLQVDG